MRDGDMLARLARAEQALGSHLLDDIDGWELIDATYETPRVERLWRDFEDGRLCLHRLHPCEKAIFHPHRCASAMKIVDGTYEMALGYQEGAPSKEPLRPGKMPPAPPYAALVVLTKGCAYEMLRPGSWHHVRPLGAPACTVMVTGGPVWEGAWVGVGQVRDLIGPETKRNLFDLFRGFYPKT